MKKTIAIFIILVWGLMSACMAAEVSMNMTVSVPKVEPGGEVVVKINANNFTREGNQKAIEAKLEYDKNILECQSVNWKSDWMGNISSDKTGLVAVKSGTVSNSETVLEMVFKVSDKAKIGNITIILKNIITSSNGDEVPANNTSISIEIFKETKVSDNGNNNDNNDNNSNNDNNNNNTNNNTDNDNQNMGQTNEQEAMEIISQPTQSVDVQSKPVTTTTKKKTTPKTTTKNPEKPESNTEETNTLEDMIKEEISNQNIEEVEVETTEDSNTVNQNNGFNNINLEEQLQEENSKKENAVLKWYILAIVVLVISIIIIIVYLRKRKNKKH